MGQLLEVVLEEVARSDAYELLRELLEKSGKIERVECSEDLQLFQDSKVSEMGFAAYLGASSDAMLLIKVDQLRICDAVIPAVLFRVMKYDDKLDIDFNFEEVPGWMEGDVMRRVQEFLGDLCNRYSVGRWFGGLEPAEDEDTRYFTGLHTGPLA